MSIYKFTMNIDLNILRKDISQLPTSFKQNAIVNINSYLTLRNWVIYHDGYTPKYYKQFESNDGKNHKQLRMYYSAKTGYIAG
ncbi:MAG: hypothetical protein LBS55_05445 [Prevotellaceae bacterium]|nr:hypothetical protein [Prevotellaceae bacterium]